MYEAMVLIKQELGGDAVIVSKRPVKSPGVFGFLKPKKLEVTAAIENSPRGITKKSDSLEVANIVSRETREIVANQIDNANEELKSEVGELRTMIQQLIEKANSVDSKENMSIMKEIMIEMDFHHHVVADFERYCQEKGFEQASITKQVLSDFINDRFNAKVKTRDASGRIRAFVGPTGVGKTTTIAKLASQETLLNGKSVGLITIDTYRIGAVEQLKIYANILDIPIKVVFAPEDLPAAIASFDDKDLIFIDSTGRSHKNMHQLNELKAYFDQFDNLETYLVLSMVTKNIDFIKTIENYRKMAFDYIILTKFDETYSFGNILNLGYFTDKPISYIAKGQVVPDDIERPSLDALLKQIWGEVK